MSKSTQQHKQLTHPPHAHPVSSHQISLKLNDLKAARTSHDRTRFSIAAGEYSAIVESRISVVCSEIPDLLSGSFSDFLEIFISFLESINSLDNAEDQMDTVFAQAEAVHDKLQCHLSTSKSQEILPPPLPPLHRPDKGKAKAIEIDVNSSAESWRSTWSSGKSVYSQASSVPPATSVAVEPLRHSRNASRDSISSRSTIASSSKRDAWFLEEVNTTFGPTPRPNPSPAFQPLLKKPNDPRQPKLDRKLDCKELYGNTPPSRPLFSLKFDKGNTKIPPPPKRDIEFDKDTGQVKAATFDELVRLLTSTDAFSDRELTTITFTWFRDMAKPTEFFLKLIDLYDPDAKCPDILLPEQARIWENTIHTKRVLIAKVMLNWVIKYWDDSQDRPVIVLLRKFVETRHGDGVSSEILNGITTHLECIAAKQPVSVSVLQPAVVRVSTSKFVKAFPPTGFKLPKSYVYAENADKRIEATKLAIPQLLQFKQSSEAIEEFTRQLTIIVSSYFMHVNPAHLVGIWRCSDNVKDKKGQRELPGSKAWLALKSFGQSLATWVSYTIVSPQITDRVPVICLWIEVALRCICHGNFYASSRILAGIEYSPVARMTDTILRVDADRKVGLSILRGIFDLSRNSSTYRRLLELNLKPIILPFTDIHIRDVVAAEARRVEEFAERARRRPCFRPLREYRWMMNVVKVLERSATPYHFVEDQPLTDWINTQIHLFPPKEGKDAYSDELYAQSQENEQKNPNVDAIREMAWIHVAVGPTFNKIVEGLNLSPNKQEQHIKNFIQDFIANKKSVLFH